MHYRTGVAVVEFPQNVICKWHSRRMRTVLTFLLTLILTACASVPQKAASPVPLVLISVDGLRPRDVTPEQMPHLSRLGRQGLRTDMRPSFPALTFPNHYSLVTGLRPDHHGIVHNQMRDTTLGTFLLKDRDAVSNPAWWGGEPLWVGVIRQGQAADTLFWPGSEAPILGVHPRRWRPYDERLTPDGLAKLLLSWLRDTQQPTARFTTLYFSQVDKASHEHGPDSNEARAARAEVDAALATLEAGMKAHGLAFNLLVVSDHGFETVPAGNRISTSNLFPTDLATPTSEGQVIGFIPVAGQSERVLGSLPKSSPQADCYSRDALPARWHYGQNPRIPPIVCQMKPGWDALYPATFARANQFPSGTRGSHGFDPDLPAMRALFIARGPAFTPRTQMPTIDNVDVYPLMRRLLGLPPAPSDGDPHRFDAVPIAVPDEH